MTVSMKFYTRGDDVNWQTHVVPCEIDEALAMWRDGFDTWDIAQALHIYEAVIYSGLPKWRGKP